MPLKELFAIEYAGMNVITGELTEHVTSLDPGTGQINWQMPDVGRVYTKRHGDDENIETSAEITAGVGSKRIKKKQKQDYVVTAASEQDLTAMFSPSGLLLSTDWDTIKDPVMREFKLEGFSKKCTCPRQAGRKAEALYGPGR